MVKLQLKDTISAYGRLLEYSAEKRYKLEPTPFTDSDVDKLAIKINEDIKKKEGLSISELQDDEDISKYESIVSNWLTEYTYTHVINPDKGERNRLFQNTYTASIEAIKSLKLNLSQALIDIIVDYEWSSEQILEACYNPIYAVASDWKELAPAEYYINTIVNFKGLDRLVFIQLTNMAATAAHSPNWFVDLIGVFTDKKYFEKLTSPIDTFFMYLEDYGSDMEIGGNKYRYIYYKAVPGAINSIEEITVRWNEVMNDPYYIKMSIMQHEGYTHFRSACMLRLENNLKDALKVITLI
jgi:hypothetical protein